MNSPSSFHVGLRIVGGLMIGLLIGVVLLVVGAHWWLSRYLHGESFRQLVSATTAAALHAEGEYLPLQWSGASAYSDGFHARGLPGSPLRELRADQIRAEIEIAGLWRNLWRFSGVEVQRLTATLGPPSQADVAAQVAPRKSGRSVRVELQPLRIHDANIEWIGAGAVSGAVRHARLLLKWGDGVWEAIASGGELRLGSIEPVRIEQAQARFQRDAAFLRDSQLRLVAGGKLTVNGQIGFGPEAAADLVVQHEGVPVDRWLPADWRGRLVGQARGQSQLKGPLGDPARMRAEGVVELTQGRLEALPVLNRLAAFTGSEQFRQLELQKARTEYTWTGRGLRLQRVLMESTGLLRMEGNCVVENGVLDGEFDLGVSAAALRWLPGARGRVFTEERDGYRWTKVKLRGPTNEIQEDLSSRLVAAAGAEAIEGAKGMVQQGAETVLGIFRRLIQ